VPPNVRNHRRTPGLVIPAVVSWSGRSFNCFDPIPRLPERADGPPDLTFVGTRSNGITTQEPDGVPRRLLVPDILRKPDGPYNVATSQPPPPPGPPPDACRPQSNQRQ
jgi:hypothetical protein